MKSDDYLLVKEVARLLGVAPNTVRKWGESGKLPEYRHPVNNYRLFKKKDVEKLRQKIEHPDPPAKPAKSKRKRSR